MFPFINNRLILKKGFHFRETVFNVNGINITIKSERFASMEHKNIIAMKYEICADQDISVLLKTGIDSNIRDINGPRLQNETVSVSNNTICFKCETVQNQVPLVVYENIYSDIDFTLIRSFEIILEINNAENVYSLSQKEELANKKNQYYQEYIQTITNEDLLPGIKNIISIAKDNGIKCAVASISKNARPILEKLDIVDMFDYIADADKVKCPKPDPEIFLTCAEALNIDPTKCVAFEDAQADIEAINSAKMMSVGIGVDVTSIAPDIVLKNTSEIDFNRTVDFYSKWHTT